MSQTRSRHIVVGLFILLFLGIAGCSDDSDKHEKSDAQFNGQLVPTGGVSMNEKFILSGHLNSGTPKITSVNEKFSLTLKQIPSQSIQ